MLPHLRPMDTGEILNGALRLHVRAFAAAALPPFRAYVEALDVPLAVARLARAGA
ncbi:MAG TPA: hypothetical protein VF006_11645 [Longimicrobium sp.]